MIKRIISAAALLLALPLLAGCIRYEGAIVASSTGTVTGNVLYAIDKSLLSNSGINSLQDLKNNSSTQEQTNFCKEPVYTENATEYVISCAFKDALLSDDSLGLTKSGEQLTFTFKNTAESGGTGDFGKIAIYVTFPGSIISVKENVTGAVVKKASNKIFISSPASTNLVISVIASASGSNTEIQTESTTTAGDTSEYLALMAQLSASMESARARILAYEKSKDKGFMRAKKECAVGARNARPPSYISAANAIKSTPASAQKIFSEFQTSANKYLSLIQLCETARVNFQASVATPTPSPIPTPSPEPSIEPSPLASSEEEEVLDGEVVDVTSISVQLLKTKNYKVSISGSPNSAYLLSATKAGSNKKYIYKIVTDSKGAKIFQTKNPLKGYTIEVLRDGSSVFAYVVR